MNKLAVILNNLGPSQFPFYMINTANEWIKKEERNDFIAFYYDCAPECSKPEFMTCNFAEAVDYDGVLVATNLNSASRALDFPGTRRKYFYVTDLEWLRIQQKNYEELLKIYRNDRMPLIVRSERHKFFLEKGWGSKVIGVVENLDINKLWEIIHKYEVENGIAN